MLLNNGFSNDNLKPARSGRSRRYSPSVSLKVFNRETGERIGPIGNMSLTGLMLHTAQTLDVGVAYPFALILPVRIRDASSLAFDARCVWSSFDASHRVCFSGFVLDNLTEKNVEIIQTLINSYAS